MKKIIVALLCLAVLAMCMACSSPSTETPETHEESSDDTITVKDAKGDVDIPAEPQRVVDVSGSADELIVLGIPFVASANTSMFDGVTVPAYLQDYFTENSIETVGNYSGAVGDLNLEKIAELEPDLIIMNIRHDAVYDQLKEIAPTLMLSDNIDYVDWRGRFEELGQWFGKEDIVTSWLNDYDAKAAELGEQIKAVTGDETFAVIEANSVHFGSYYVYSAGGVGELVYEALDLPASSGVPENVWGEVVDAEYFANIDADHIFFFSDDGTIGETANVITWQNLKAVQEGNVYYGINEEQYNMAYTPNGKLIYIEKIANAVINRINVE